MIEKTIKERAPFYERLLDAQMEIGAIKKDSKNPFFNSKYFDINSLLSAVKPVLNAHGIILLQPLDTTGMDEDDMGLTTILQDAYSEYNISYSVPLPMVADAQKAGSAITYFRRYAVQSILALEAEDDDAEVAMGRKTETRVVKEDVPF